VESVAINEEYAAAGAKALSQSDQFAEQLASGVRAYLSLWRLGDEEWLRECSHDIVQAALHRSRSEPGANPSELIFAEVESFLGRYFAQLAPGENDQSSIALASRAALIFGAPEQSTFSDPVQLRAAFLQGRMNYGAARVPSRPPETRATTMKTSLSRLPSIRLIGGWILCVLLLILTFILTH
jgi:hypothetical protein